MEKQVIIGKRYHIIRKIGEGGTANVYLAHDQKEDRNVSLKILKKENIDDRKVKKFKREAQTLSRLDDDNIVRVYDVGDDGNLHYIVAEYIDGMTLKDYIKTCSPIPVDEIVKLSKQILQGIKHAHERGVVHKDIKSQNILLDENKNPKITDFGIADILDEEVTRTQSLMGTPQYIAPEILNREHLTPQSDLYAVGIVMYEMCTTQVPFAGEKASYIMIKQMSQPLPSIVAQRSDIPQSLENIIIKATAKKLENRYSSAQEMLDDLNNVFNPDNADVEPLVLEDDLLKNDEIEKTIDIGAEKIDLSQYKEIENKKQTAKKKQRRIIIGVLATLLVVAIGLLIVAHKNKIKMPDLVNENNQDALTQLTTLGIPQENISIVEEFSDEIEQDKVIKTEPPAGDAVNNKTPITLYVSKGKEQQILDNYVGKLAGDVKAQLEKEGYKVEIQYETSDQKQDVILRQFPDAGAQIKQGDTITLMVSGGKAKVKVPNFSNMSKNEVDAWARENVISITYESTCNNSVAANHVISQSVSHGTELNVGDQITVSISTGPCPTPQTNEEQETQGSSNE